MPLMRYFFFVGGALLMLMFISNAMLPMLPISDQLVTATDLPVVRIQSDRKWPERVVFDTSVPANAPATNLPPPLQTEANVPSATTVADVPAGGRVREAFARFTPAAPKGPALKPQRRRKIAKSRVGAPIMQVAQQPRFGFFANNTW